MNGQLPDYSACTYSLFVSYSHGDNRSRNGYIEHLAEALRDQLTELENNGETKLGVHMSGKNGPLSGVLSEALMGNMEKSYACLLVIDAGYVRSEWCRKELAYFARSFGAQGAKHRLFIAVLSSSALKEAEAHAEWAAIIPADIIWVPFYQDDSPKSLHRAKTRNSFESDFIDLTHRISRPLIASIFDNIERQKVRACDNDAVAAAITRTPWAVDTSKPLTVGVGPFTKDMEEHAQRLRRLLEETGANVRILDQELMHRYNVETGAPLRAQLAKLDLLVVPISDAEPLQLNFPGGHTTILRDEWGRQCKSRPIIWFRPDRGALLPESAMAEAKHLEAFAKLTPVAPDEHNVRALLFGRSANDPVKIRIEKGTHFLSIRRALEAAWKKLRIDDSLPELVCSQFDFKGLHAATDASGVVILQPYEKGSPTRTESGIRSQVALILDQFEQAKQTHPNCVVVAIIYEPPKDQKYPENDFIHIHVRRSDYQLDAEDGPDVDEFLKDLLIRHREAASAMPPIRPSK